jgi:putative aldouronate transport system substrate-binding protein
MLRRKQWGTVGTLMLAGSIMLAGCSSGDPNNVSPSNAVSPTAGATDAEKTSDKKFAIELIETGWVNTPTDDSDPFKKWIDETFNVDFTLTTIPANDFESKLFTRFSGSNQPDLIFVAGTDRTLFQKLYNQGVLLDDWVPLLDKVPTAAATMSDVAKKYVSQDGKMFALPRQPDANTWSFKIRKDWLDKLSLQIPQTDTELIEVFKQFTFNDPDGNNQADTWGATSAGAGANFSSLSQLENMYGQMGFQVTNNQVDHSILNGTHQKFLDFVKLLQDEKIIDPDWYTQDWEQKKVKLGTDKVGVDQYPGVLLSEYEANTSNTGKAADIWTNLPMPKGTDSGGKLPADAPVSGMLAISANAAKDPEKLERVLQLIEGVTYPNDGYWKIRWGVGITGETMTDLDNGAKFFSETKDSSNYRSNVPGAWDYGTWIATNRDSVLQSTAKEPGAVQEKTFELDNETINAARYQDFESLLTLDPQLLNDVTRLQNEFDIKYVLGNTSDYEAFKAEWLKAGGQQLLDSATEQYKALGYIK